MERASTALVSDRHGAAATTGLCRITRLGDNSLGCITPKPLKWLFGRSISRFGNGNALASIDSEFPTLYVVHTRVIGWKIAVSSVIRLFLQPQVLPVNPIDSFRGH